MDQLYGVRWSQSFGNDPLGRYKNADGERNPRMDQWIATLAPVSWERLRAAVTQIRRRPKPQDFDGWLPDLQYVTGLVESRSRGPAGNLMPPAAWIGRLCDARLMVTMKNHGPFSHASLEALKTVTRQAKEKFRAMARTGDLSAEGSPEEAEVIVNYLAIQYSKLTIEKMSEEEWNADLARWQRERGLLQTPHRN